MTTSGSRGDAADPPGDIRASTWQRPPGWLLLPPATPPPPPVETRAGLLPVDRLTWEDFERLCLRLLALEAETVHVNVSDAPVSTAPVTRGYGARGQKQLGIDIYSRDPLALGQPSDIRRYVVLQARRIKKVTKTALRRSVKEFLDGSWSKVSRKFIYATSCLGVATEFTAELEMQAERLAGQSIELEVWDAEALSDRLRGHPEIVDEFFGREWVCRFLGADAGAALTTRLDAHQTAELRRRLAAVYAAAFGVADSGLLALRLSAQPAVAIHDRFVTPDLLGTSAATASVTATASDGGPGPAPGTDDHETSRYEPPRRRDSADWSAAAARSRQHRARPPRAATAAERMPADAWLGQGMRQVVVGEPGAGKSTLLRYLVLDLLDETPRWGGVAERWGRRLPVWLPFHFYTQRVAGQTGAPASVGSAIRAWFEQHGVGDLWPLVEAALADDRLLLVVDGLDEWVDDEAGRSAAASLETFASAHAAAVVVSTRPYGLTKLTLGAGWDYARVAPLSAAQQRTLAYRYFQIAAAGAEGGEGPVTHAAAEFIEEVRASPDLLAVSGVPLFLVLLVGLRLASAGKLPERRFEVYDRASALLIADHPARRRAAAAVTARRRTLSDRQVRAVLAEVAFISLDRGDIGAIAEKNLRRDFVSALRNPDTLGLDTPAALSAADELMDVAEGELGVIVRKAPGEFGFLHRMLQDQLAAEYAADRLDADAQPRLFDTYLGDPRWREVLLALLWRTSRPAELRTLVEAVQANVGDTPTGLAAREVLADVVFGPFNLPGGYARELAPALIDAVETHSYGAHRARLLDVVSAGSASVTTGDLVDAALDRWAVQVARPTASLVWHLAQLPAQEDLFDAITTSLGRALAHGDVDVAYLAAAMIASRCADLARTSDRERGVFYRGALRVVADPASATAQAAALAALALGWREDAEVMELLREARGSADETVRFIVLADAFGVLRRVLMNDDAAPSVRPDVSPTEEERRWLTERLLLDRGGGSDAHDRVRVETVAAAIRGDEKVKEHCLRRMNEGVGPDLDFAWNVALRAYPDDDAIGEVVCRLLREEDHSWVTLGLGREGILGDVYADNPYRTAVADAIERHLDTFGSRHRETLLYELARIDHGPRMRAALLQDLAESSFPHWAARSLAENFLGDMDVQATLRDTLCGDPIRASMVANAAPLVLDPQPAVARLLDILRGVSGKSGAARHDIVAFALIQACSSRSEEADSEAIAAEALSLMPTEPDLWLGDPSYELAAAFYPMAPAKEALRRLADNEDHPLTPFLRAYRDDVHAVRPFADEAETLFRSVADWQRHQLCQLLASRPASPRTVMQFTRRWREEVSESNLSAAALAFHTALAEELRAGLASDNEWTAAREEIKREGAAYGPTHEARRRAAWVGMCVTQEWSVLDGLVETIGEPRPVGVPLSSPLNGPDLILLRQVAAHWPQLREHFGEALLPRLSGLRAAQGTAAAWNALALVATQSAPLEAELEDAVAADPDLLAQEGVLAWFATRPGASPEAVADALLQQLPASSNARGVAARLLADADRVGLTSELVVPRLEDRLGTRSGWGDAALETLAALAPDHPQVTAAWAEFSRVVDESYVTTSGDDERPAGRTVGPHPQTYFAVAYAAAPALAVVAQMRRDLAWLTDTSETLFEEDFVRHVARRLRRDPRAAGAVRSHIADPETPDAEAAAYASLLAAAIPLDQALIGDLRRRAVAQASHAVAPIVRDPVFSSSLPVKTVLCRVTDVSIG